MAAPIDFYFDFSSPYGYFASTRIDALAAKYGREVTWRPVLLGAIFKVTGGQPGPMVPLKGNYVGRDFVRSAAFYGIPYRTPTTFPVSTQAPVRAFYWLNEQDPAKAKGLASSLYHAYFVDDINISNPADTVAVAAKTGLEAAKVEAAINDSAIKEKVKTEVDRAITQSVFGSPLVVVDGEAFWGMDRLDQLDKWLETGGW
jgi:2-hydroxychromene-2-carboxylate isomerase